jgi:hypothetical protein
LTANINGSCLIDANLSKWIITDITCTHIFQARGEGTHRMDFEPKEFEKRYTYLEHIAEIILKMPLTETIGFIGSFIARSINHLEKSPVVAWKGTEALSDGDTKITFNIYDSDFFTNKKELIETILKDALNEYFAKNPLKNLDYTFDPIENVSEGIIKIKREISIPGTPLEIDTSAIGEKALKHFIRMGKTGEDILNIVTNVFK